MSMDTTRVHLERLVEIDLNAVKTIKSNNSIYSTITLPNDVKHNMKQMITVARSKLMLYTSLLGIIAKQNIKPDTIIGFIDGLIIQPEIYAQLEIMINTGILISSPKAKRRYVLLGTAFSMGSIINDIKDTGYPEPNVEIILNEELLIKWEKGGSDGENNNNEFIYKLIELRAIKEIKIGDELLLDYGQKEFWENHHTGCIKCFKTHNNNENKIILCNAMRKKKKSDKEKKEKEFYDCKTEIHINCIDEGNRNNSVWICPECNIINKKPGKIKNKDSPNSIKIYNHGLTQGINSLIRIINKKKQVNDTLNSTSLVSAAIEPDSHNKVVISSSNTESMNDAADDDNEDLARVNNVDLKHVDSNVNTEILEQEEDNMQVANNNSSTNVVEFCVEDDQVDVDMTREINLQQRPQNNNNSIKRGGRSSGRKESGTRFCEVEERSLVRRFLQHFYYNTNNNNKDIKSNKCYEVEKSVLLPSEYENKFENRDYYGDENKYCHTWCSLNGYRLDYDKVKNCLNCPENKDRCKEGSNSIMAKRLWIYEERLKVRSNDSSQQLLLDAINQYINKQKETILLNNASSNDNSSNQNKLENISPNETRCNYYGVDLCLNCYSLLYGFSHGTIYKYIKEATKKGVENYEHGNTGIKSNSSLDQATIIGRKLLAKIIDDYGQIDPAEAGGKGQHAEVVHLPDSNYPDLLKRIKNYAKEHDEYKHLADNIMSISTLIRIIKSEYNYDGSNRKIRLRTHKSTATCDTCNDYRNRLEQHIESEEAREELIKAYNEHLALAKEQRDKYTKHIRKASALPMEYWCIAWDGMDQAKTEVPHQPIHKQSKFFEKLEKLKLHIRGILCSGGPIPSALYVCPEHILNNSDLTVTIIHDFLFNKCLNAKPIEIIQHTGIPIPDNKDDQIDNNPILSEEDISCTRSDYIPAYHYTTSTYCTHCKPSSNTDKPNKQCPKIEYRNRFPRKLYLQLDNAAKDNKNKTVYLYCAILVSLGIFESIKIGFGVVGHTHDRIDQLFSRLSVALNHLEAFTLSDIMKIFHQAYSSQLDDQTNKKSNNNKLLSALPKPNSVLNKYATNAVYPMVAEVNKVALFRQFIENDLALTDAIKRLGGIANANIVKICLDPNEPNYVSICAREFAGSLTKNMRLLNGKGVNSDINSNKGMYEPPLKLFEAIIADKSLNYDPYIKPYEYVNYKSKLESIKQCKTHYLCDQIHVDIWEERRIEYEISINSCDTCKSLSENIAKIKLPSRYKLINDALAKLEYNEKYKSKEKTRQSLYDHIKDLHNDKRFKGFWSILLLSAPQIWGRFAHSKAAEERKAQSMLDKQEKLLFPHSSRLLQQDWGSDIKRGMIVALEMNPYAYPEYPAGIALAIVTTVKKNSNENDEKNINPLLHVTFLDTMPEFKKQKKYIQALELCYKLQFMQLKASKKCYINQIKKTLSKEAWKYIIENKLIDNNNIQLNNNDSNNCNVTAGSLSDEKESSSKDNNTTVTINTDFTPPNNKSSSEEPEENSININSTTTTSSSTTTTSSSSSIIPTDTANNATLRRSTRNNNNTGKTNGTVIRKYTKRNVNNNNKSIAELHIPRTSEGIPVAFELDNLYNFKLGVDPNYKYIDDRYVKYKLDENNQPIENPHIIGRNRSGDKNYFLPVNCLTQVSVSDNNILNNKSSKKRGRNVAELSNTNNSYQIISADPMLLFETEDEIIEKAHCIAWAFPNQVFKGNQEDLSTNPITGWPIKVQNLALRPEFIQLIRQNLNERKQEEIMNDNNITNSHYDLHDVSVLSSEILEEEKESLISNPMEISSTTIDGDNINTTKNTEAEEDCDRNLLKKQKSFNCNEDNNISSEIRNNIISEAREEAEEEEEYMVIDTATTGNETEEYDSDIAERLNMYPQN